MKCPACGKSLWFAKTECPFCHAALPAIVRPPRPWTVSVPGWIFFAAGILSLASLAANFLNPELAEKLHESRLCNPLDFYLRLLMPLLMSVMAILVLRGSNLARWIFIIWFGTNAASQAVKHFPTAWPVSLAFMVLMGLWLLPRSNAFFQALSAAVPAAEKAPGAGSRQAG